MSRRQRFTFLAIAAAIAVVAVVVLADSSEDDTQPSRTAATATSTPTPPDSEPESADETPTPTPTPKPPPLLQAGKVTELEFTEGETVRFRVRSQEPEEIHVHCYDIEREVPAGRTITLSFKASITGICEVEFHNSGEPIGELRVDPK
jgi:hypothetical protein